MTENILDRVRRDPEWAAREIERLTQALDGEQKYSSLRFDETNELRARLATAAEALGWATSPHADEQQREEGWSKLHAALLSDSPALAVGTVRQWDYGDDEHYFLMVKVPSVDIQNKKITGSIAVVLPVEVE